MLLLQYIDELQDSKSTSISRKYGGSPLQMDFLRQRINQARSSSSVLKNENDSSITGKCGDCPPLEMGVLQLKIDQTDPPVDILETEKCSPLEKDVPPPVYEADQTAFDLIIKYPAESLRRALTRNGVETWINDFLDTLFNLGTDPNPPTEDRQTSPLTYEHHEAIRQDQTITEVKVRLQLRPGLDAESTRTANLQLCEKIHSARAREEKTCSFYLSTLDIFGLEPVQGTEFSICWDAAFFSQMISDGQNVLGSLTAQATSLASNLVGLCEWAASDLLLLTQILRQSGVGSKSCNAGGVLFTCLQPSVLLSLLEAAVSLLTKLAEWKRAHWLPSAQAKQDWKNDVRQASRELQTVITAIAVLATAAGRVEMPDEQLMKQAKELYFTSHRFLRACQQAITCNRAIWHRFQAGYLAGGSGVVFGTGLIAVTAHAGIESGIASLVPAAAAIGIAGAAVSVASLGYGVFELWNTKQYDSICESFDECLVTTLHIMFSCETITRRLFLPQNEPVAGGSAANLQREKWWQDFMNEAIRITGENPDTTTFTLHRHYIVYLAVQNSGLQRVQRRLDQTVAQSRFRNL